jgi:hypothetical protein
MFRRAAQGLAVTAFIWGMSMITLIYILFYVLITAVAASDQEYKERLGTKIIIEKDTLKVVDYSFSDKQFVLSDGRVLNSTLILQEEKNKVINLN